MNNSFSTPQRQSLVGVVVMFADTLQGTLRAMWPILLVWIFKVKETNILAITGGVAAVTLLLVVIAYLKYYNFTFFLDEENDEFVIRKGIINKSRIAIPLNKIQQVNINQSLIQRLIGVYALEVDTAGSSKKEVTVKAITQHLALAIKDRLSENEKSAIDAESGDGMANLSRTKVHPFITISFLSLLKTGITSNYARSFAILFAGVITIYQNVEEYISATGYQMESIDEYINTTMLLRFTVFIILAVLVLTLVINLTRTILRYYNYRITRQQNSLLLSYGLLSTKSTIIRPERVQILTVGRNYFQKKMDIQDLRIRQASNMDSGNRQQLNQAIEIPGCNTDEKNTLLSFILGQVPEKGIMLKPNIRKLAVNAVKLLVIPVGIYFTLGRFIFPSLMDYVIFLPAYILFMVVMIYFGFRNSRLFVNNDFIIKQSGAWDIDTEYLELHKIQAVRLTQLFWQKSADIGSVKLYTGGGSIHFSVTNYTKLKHIANYWLYQVETTGKNWM